MDQTRAGSASLWPPSPVTGYTVQPLQQRSFFTISRAAAKCVFGANERHCWDHWGEASIDLSPFMQAT